MANHENGKCIVNPAIMGALVKRYETLSDSEPVDTYSYSAISYNKLSRLQDPTHKKAVQWLYSDETKKTGARAYSFVQRSAFAALEKAKRKCPKMQISHITVNFDHVQSEIIKTGNSKHAGAAFYGNRLKVRFKSGLPKQGLSLKVMPRFTVNIEDSQDGSVHAHIVIVHHSDDKHVLNAMCRVEAKKDNNAVMIQTSYRKWLEVPVIDPEKDIETGKGRRAYVQRLSDVNEVNHLDRLYDKAYGTDYCRYPLMGLNKCKRVGFYRNAPVDVGLVDYLSKEVAMPVIGYPRATRLFMDGETRADAAKIYADRYKQVSSFIGESDYDNSESQAALSGSSTS